MGVGKRKSPFLTCVLYLLPMVTGLGAPFAGWSGLLWVRS